MAPSFLLLKSLCSVGNLTKHFSLQYSCCEIITPNQKGCESKTYSDQSISSFFDRVWAKNCLSLNSRITVVARQPQELCLVPTTSQFIVLMTYGDIHTIPVYSPEDYGFILVQLVHWECPCTSLYSY